MNYNRVKGPRRLPESVTNIDELLAAARSCYDRHVQVEIYTDEMHVWVLRRDGKRRDFVASYQAGG